MNKKIFVFTAFLFCFAVAFAQKETGASSESENVINLTVDEAVKLALENNVSVKTSELALDLKKRQKNSSWNSVSPTASVSGSFNDDLENDRKTTSVTGTIGISLSPSIYSSIKKAVLEYEAGKLSYEETARKVELNVRKSFYNILYEQENIAAQEKSLETAQQTYDANLAKYNRGQLSELDLLSSQYKLESKKPNIISLKNTYKNDIASFKQILGIGLSLNIHLEGDFDDVIKNLSLNEEILSGDLDALPSIKSAQNNVDTAKASLLASRFSAYGPTVTGSYSYGKSHSSLTGDENTNKISLGVSIPLDGWLPWSSGALSVASQKEKLEELQLKLDDERTSAAISVRNSYNTILQAQSQLETLKKNVELMQRTYDMTRIAYNNGSKDLLTLQSAEDNLLSAKTSLQLQEYTLITNVLTLESTLGVPFGTFSKANS